MQKKLLTFYILLLVVFSSNAQYAGLEKIVVDQSVSGLESFTVYRIYARVVNDNDQLVSIYGGLTSEISRVGATGELFQHPALGPTSTSFDGVDFETDPLLEFDSYLTIGMGTLTQSADLSNNELSINGNIFTSEFESGVGSFFIGSTITPGELVVSAGSEQGIPDSDGRVLIAQITSTGEPEGVINLKILKSDGTFQFIESIDLTGSSGCTNPFASNYDESATYHDGSCLLNNFGCTDESATNYDPNADADDGSCIIPGCTDPEAENYNNNATENDGSCVYLIFGCTDEDAVNFNPNADIDDGTCIIQGCTDPEAENYNNNANEDDGTCIYPSGCTDPLAVNYDDSAILDDESCLFAGCTDPIATNYNSNADLDDGSCIYPLIEGCTDPLAVNYNPEAEIDNGSCYIEGCTNANAINYDPTADTDDGSCIVAGCTNTDALNFDPEANFDDNSCVNSCNELELELNLDQQSEGFTFGLCEELDGVYPFTAEFFVNASGFESISIDWGDGDSDSFPFIPLDAFHQYEEQGDYVIQMSMQAEFGCSVSRSYSVINMSLPEVSLDLLSDTELCSGEEFNTLINGWENNHESTTYRLESTDNSLSQEFSHPPANDFTHSFAQPSCLYSSFDGTEFAYGVRIIAENQCGYSTSDLPAIFVSGQTENASTNFTITTEDQEACPGEDISIVNTSSGYITANLEGCQLTPPSQFSISPSEGWEVVEGSLDNGSFTTVRFNVPQLYEVLLSDVNICGATQSSAPILVVENAGTIDGVVSLDGDLSPEIEVVAFNWNNDAGEFQVVESTQTDADGAFSFNLNEGSYQVKAIPSSDQEDVMPMYTNETWSWMEAEVMEVGCSINHITDIQLNTINTPGVNVNLSGALYYRDQFKSMEGDPIPGIPIIVEKDTTESQAVAVTTTNLLGEYSFSEIPPGEYKLLVEMPGLPMAETHYFTITDNNQVMTELNFYADSLDQIYTSDIVSVFEQSSQNGPELKIFPNPTHGSTTFQIEGLNMKDFQLVISNGSGQVLEVPIWKGKSKWMVDLTSLPDGFYVYRLWNGNTVKSGTIFKQ